MRNLVPLALLALLGVGVVGAVRLARADDGTAPSPEVLAQRIEELKRQTAYLMAREARLTGYVLRNAERGEALKRLAAELRAGGFAAAANPSPVRERLLAGLEALGDGLKKDLPAVTAEETKLLTPGR